VGLGVWSGATANDLHQAMTRIRLLAYVILDGTLIPIDRVHDHKPYYSGKHRRHGMNVQVIVDAAGRLVWASAAIPGSARDLTAVRTHGIIAALTNADVMTFAGQGISRRRRFRAYPFKRHRYRPKLSPAEGREQGPRPDPLPRRTRRRHPQDLENPTKLRCSPSRTTAMVQAILVLHRVEHPTYQG